MSETSKYRPAFLAGFRAIMPLWLGGVPFALVYVVAARKAGFSPVEIQLMSLLIFNSAVQVSMVGLVAAGASLWAILFPALTLTIQNVLYGLSLSQKLRFSPFGRLVAACLLTDGAFAVTVAAGEVVSVAYLLGAEISMYFIWNAGTFLGLVLNQVIVDPVKLGLNFVIPLMFVVLLVPLLKTRFELKLLVAAVICAYLSNLFLPAGVTVLLTGLVSATLGAFFAPSPSKKQAQNIRMNRDNDR